MSRLTPIPILLAAVAVLLCPAPSPAEVTPERFQPLVQGLADPSLGGRVTGTPGRQRAASLIASAFRDAGLEPSGDAGGYLQGFAADGGAPAGANVVGIVRGTGAEVVIVGAHYDGVSERNGGIVPGAEDNAAAVSAMTEIAREVAATAAGAPPARSVLFVAFDGGNLEPPRFTGSRAFVGRPPVPLDSVAFVLDLSMLGGDLVRGRPSPVFALGSNEAPLLDEEMQRAADAESCPVLRGGVYLIERLGPRSDYGAFRDRHIPYAFVSTGPTERFHTPRDTAEAIDYAKLTRIARFALRLVLTYARGAPRPVYVGPHGATAYEAREVSRLVRYVIDAREVLNLSGTTVEALQTRLEETEGIASYGAPDERDAAYLQRTLETLLFLTTSVRPVR